MLRADAGLFTGFVFAVGLIVGSFLNVVIHRLPKMLERSWRRECSELLETTVPDDPAGRYDLIAPGSHCPGCGHRIRAWENIPIISWLFLRARCSACGMMISVRYPLVELAAALTGATVAWHFGFGWECLGALALTWSLLALTMIDFDHQLLPDAITLPLLWLGLLFSLFTGGVSPQDAIIGAAAGYLSLWSIYWLFKLATGKEGMGYGDFKLLAVLGAWLGWQALPAVVLLSAVVGALVGVALIVAQRLGRSVPMPFGPYLAAAGWIALLWGTDLNQAYLRLAGLA
ncbi:MAG: A24 family peptidase [Xanthomonadaceae bacterium]|nr:A24 family peptidase [Xanthomonadaceae bacterium]